MNILYPGIVALLNQCDAEIFTGWGVYKVRNPLGASDITMLSDLVAVLILFYDFIKTVFYYYNLNKRTN